jgi:hypothetical protein
MTHEDEPKKGDIEMTDEEEESKKEIEKLAKKHLMSRRSKEVELTTEADS